MISSSSSSPQQRIVSLARRTNELVSRFPESFHARILQFCQGELTSAKMFGSRAQGTTNVLTSALSEDDAARLFAFVSDLDREFRASSEHFIEAAVEKYYRQHGGVEIL